MKKTILFICMLLVMASCRKEETETNECDYLPLTFTTSPAPMGGKDNSGKIELGSNNGQTGALINYIEDNLQIGNINSLSSVYNKLTSTTNSGNDLKSKLITSYPNKSSQINQLFTSYGY